MEGVKYRIIFLHSSNTYKIFRLDGNIKLIKKVKMEYINLLGTNFHYNILYYNPSGSPSRGGTVELKEQDNIYSLKIQVGTGRVRIVKNE